MADAMKHESVKHRLAETEELLENSDELVDDLGGGETKNPHRCSNIVSQFCV